MGFGTLFIGYFFLVNISYFEYTDIVSAMIMLLGLYSLSRFNRGFKVGFFFDAAFAVFSLAELIISVISMFNPYAMGGISATDFSILRYALIFGITVSCLMGISEVAREVEANSLANRAGRITPWCAVYLISAICDVPKFAELLGPAMQYVFAIAIIGHLVIVATVLITIYKAYATICMPEDLEPKNKKSIFGFINKLNEREEQKNLEYADYKIKKGLEQEKKKSKKK